MAGERHGGGGPRIGCGACTHLDHEVASNISSVDVERGGYEEPPLMDPEHVSVDDGGLDLRTLDLEELLRGSGEIGGGALVDDREHVSSHKETDTLPIPHRYSNLCDINLEYEYHRPQEYMTPVDDGGEANAHKNPRYDPLLHILHLGRANGLLSRLPWGRWGRRALPLRRGRARTPPPHRALY